VALAVSIGVVAERRSEVSQKTEAHKESRRSEVSQRLTEGTEAHRGLGEEGFAERRSEVSQRLAEGAEAHRESRRLEVSQRFTEGTEAHRVFLEESAERRLEVFQRHSEGAEAHGGLGEESLREPQAAPLLEAQRDPSPTLPYAPAGSGNNPETSPLLRAIPPVAFAGTEPAFPTYFANAPKRRTPKTPNWWLGASAYYSLSSVRRTGLYYVQLRADEETALDVLHTGLDVRRRIGNRYFWQTGLYFTQWTDRRTTIFNETYTEMDSNYLVARILRSDGTIENVYGAAEIQRTLTFTRETYNRYRHVEVPILAGLSLPAGARWRFDVSAGPVIGLLGTRSGVIRHISGMGTQPLPDAPYRNSATIAGAVRIEWLYATRDWSAGIGIMGRMALSDWAETNPYFSEKRSAIGAGVVFRRALGW